MAHPAARRARRIYEGPPTSRSTRLPVAPSDSLSSVDGGRDSLGSVRRPVALMECQRAAFDFADEGLCYLNSSYLGPLPLTARAAAADACDRQASPWAHLAGKPGEQLSSFYADVEDARAGFAALIGATADDIALTPATSYAMAVACKNLLPVGTLGPGDQVLVIEQQFQSNYYVWEEAATAAGAEMLVVSRPANFDWTTAILEALGYSATSPQTDCTIKAEAASASTLRRIKLVTLPTVHWQDGSRLDLVTIGAACRAIGAKFVVDATQSAGAVPFDVSMVQPDFLTVSAYKWLLCPYGLAFLYASPDNQQGVPLEHHNWERSGSDFYKYDFTAGARRYDAGQRSNFITLPGAVASLRQLAAWGPANIERYIAPLIERAVERALALRMTVPPSAARSDHMIGVRVAEGSGLTEDDLQVIAAELLAKGIHVSIRGTAIRISPNVCVQRV